MNWSSLVASLAVFVLAVATPGIGSADSGRAKVAPPSKTFDAVGTVEVAFTPGDRIDNLIVDAIDAAQHEVLVNAYTFTQKRIATALVAARKRGLAVAVIADLQEARSLPQNVLPQMVTGGVDVWLDGNYQAAHNKIIVIDADSPKATTITGSYNFTVAAQFHNAENVVILRNNREVAAAYRDNWERLKAHATKWSADALR